MIRRIEASALIALFVAIIAISVAAFVRMTVWVLTPDGALWLAVIVLGVFVLSFALDTLTGGGLSGDE